jgi:nicotinate-nucleotide--dimethylbenzimidazole phosphoribosyltransferase
MTYEIPSTADAQLGEYLQKKINFKTKPLGALGDLEKIALKIGLIQRTESPVLTAPNIVVFAADHGIARSGVSAYPQEVTYQMVLNFLNGGAAINVFCRQNGIALTVADAGVNFNFEPNNALLDVKMRPSTSNFHDGTSAMSLDECREAMKHGGDIVENIQTKTGCNVIGFGEMGIGNTTAASLIMHRLTQVNISECVGRGTGVNDEQFERKLEIINEANNNAKIAFFGEGSAEEMLKMFAHFGGFEMAMMLGAYLKAAELRMLILVDGFIATAAYLAAVFMNENVKEYALPCHQSHENGHKHMMSAFNESPVLQLSLRLGEGTGAAIALPIIRSAVAFLNEMSSFEAANVANKD